MTTYKPFANYEYVTLINDTEVLPAFVLPAGTKGIVIDSCVPDCYKISLENYGIYWIFGNKLKRETK